ncbi:MAG: NnrU family protein [Burkholderiaceae bacterium]|nr:NnrU family protein [Sulfuritalea sp.]MCF8176865.1 NnrU family protein [Burkholderiaceae bacterium]
MSFLILGLAIFLGVHSLRLFAADWRDAQCARLGEARWKGVYSLISLVGLGLIIWGYGMARVDAPVLWPSPSWTRHLAALLTLPAFILIVAAYVPGNRIKAALGHPMVAGVKLWALAHLLANGNLADALLFGSFLAWAVASFAISRRRDRLAGKTYAALGWPRDVAVAAIGISSWAAFAMLGHTWLIGVRPF